MSGAGEAACLQQLSRQVALIENLHAHGAAYSTCYACYACEPCIDFTSRTTSQLLTTRFSARMSLMCLSFQMSPPYRWTVAWW